MTKKGDQQPVNRAEFFGETRSIRAELKTETQTIRNEMATKDYVKNIVESAFKKLRIDVMGVQNEFIRFKDETRSGLFKCQLEIEELKKTMMTREDGLRILDRFDDFAQKYEVYGRKVQVHDHRLGELEKRSSDHETRIKKLEA